MVRAHHVVVQRLAYFDERCQALDGERAVVLKELEKSDDARMTVEECLRVTGEDSVHRLPLFVGVVVERAKIEGIVRCVVQ